MWQSEWITRRIIESVDEKLGRSDIEKVKAGRAVRGFLNFLINQLPEWGAGHVSNRESVFPRAAIIRDPPSLGQSPKASPKKCGTRSQDTKAPGDGKNCESVYIRTPLKRSGCEERYGNDMAFNRHGLVDQQQDCSPTLAPGVHYREI